MFRLQHQQTVVTTLQVTLMPGGGTPLHYHRNFSETFVVTEGRLTVVMGKKTLTLGAGQKITVEKGQPHRFANKSSLPVVFTTIILPGSEGFENALRILYGLAGDQKTDKKRMQKPVGISCGFQNKRYAPQAWGYCLPPGTFNCIANLGL